MERIAPHIVFADDLSWAGLAGIQLANAPATLTVNEHTLLRKDEFHVTILAGKFLAPLLDNQDEEHAREFLRNDLLEFAQNHDFTLFTFTATII